MKTVYNDKAAEYMTKAAQIKLIINEYEEKRKNTGCEALRRYYVHRLMALYTVYNECLHKARKLSRMASAVNV